MNKIKLTKNVMGVFEEVSNLLAPRSSLLAPRSNLLPPPSFLLAPPSYLLALTSSLLALLLPQAAEASHIEETLTLENGWNGVYLESTPDTADCTEFFKDLPVTKVMRYYGRGSGDSAQIDEFGRDILQPEVYYAVWNVRAPAEGTLRALEGGHCYLVFTTNKCTKTFLGVPATPDNFWWETPDVNDLINLVGVSHDPNTNVTAKAYFGEGPYDGGKVYKVGGKDESKPTMMQLLGAAPTVTNGMAYSLSAKRGGPWPGVISAGSGWLLVANGTGYLKVDNVGTSARTFRMRMVKSAKPAEKFPPLKRELPRTTITDPVEMTNVVEGQSWDVPMPLDGSTLQVFKSDPAHMVTGETYAAVLEIEDRGASAMRVRVPVLVVYREDDSLGGLWAGALALDKVSSIDGRMVPFQSAGIMALNVLMHVDASRTARLLQRATVATDANGPTVVFLDPKGIPDGWTVGRQLFTGMMSVAAPVADEVDGSGFDLSNGPVFAWGVPERARDNPFRHAWHPEHDGLSSDYSMEVPTGDDFKNYTGPTKPELWSITNTLSFKLDGKYVPNADETMEGDVVWDVGGLVSTNTIRSTGRFRLRRILRNVEFVK